MSLARTELTISHYYIDAVLEQLHYLLGRNAMNKVYISGIGDNYVRFHHYAPSISDTVTEPWPGFVSGGPNNYLSGDPVLDPVINAGTPPAKCFVDNPGQTSYASNEPCLPYNAPWEFVLAYFIDGETGPWNRPPNTPSQPSGPTSGTTGTSYNYSTFATDPDGDQVKYTFDWGDGSTTDTTFVNSGQTASASHSWSTAGTYQVKVKATDTNNATSAWSTALTVTINPSAGGD